MQKISARELADLINSSKEFVKTDLTYHTEWDMEYFYALFSAIELDTKANYVQSWILIKWKEEHGFYSKYNNSQELEKQYKIFEAELSNVRRVVLDKRNDEKLLKDLEAQFNSFGDNENSTGVSSFQETATSTTTNYRIDDLPRDVKNIVLLKDDAIFSCFVEDMKGPVKQWIDKHNLKDWNVVKFACMVHHIIARKTAVSVFAKLLSHIFSGMDNQEENMKKRKDANKENIDYYTTNNHLWQLKNDVKAVEECLANTIEKLKEVA